MDVYQGEQLLITCDLMYCPMLDYDVIDFTRSLFFIGNVLMGKKIYSFGSKEEFLAFRNSNPLIRYEKIFLNEIFDKQLDFFNPRFGEMYVSDRLKEAIEKEGLTGVKILKTSEPIIEC